MPEHWAPITAAPPPLESWRESHISAYAAAHPWEDFAETFAHYLHIVDVLATAGDLQVSLRRPNEAATQVGFNPHFADAATLIACWIPFASSLNAINRSMGYPISIRSRRLRRSPLSLTSSYGW